MWIVQGLDFPWQLSPLVVEALQPRNIGRLSSCLSCLRWWPRLEQDLKHLAGSYRHIHIVNHIVTLWRFSSMSRWWSSMQSRSEEWRVQVNWDFPAYSVLRSNGCCNSIWRTFDRKPGETWWNCHQESLQLVLTWKKLKRYNTRFISISKTPV